MTHGEHTQSTQFLGCIKDDRRETRGHFGVETHLNSGLNFVFTLHQQIQDLFSMDDSLTIIGHQTDEGSIPLVGNLGECGGT